MKSVIIFIMFLAMFAEPAAQSKVGTTAANFLNIPIGSRATGMGGAFASIANDATTMFYNPGGLSRITGNEFTASYTEWLVSTKLNWLGVAVKLDENNAIGISVNQLDYGDEEITTAEQPNGTGQRWDAQDLAISLSYARNLTDRFSIGGTFKYITQRIWNESATAFAIDVGLLFYTQIEGLRIGMNISNFGSEMKMDGKDLLLSADIDPNNAGNNPNIASRLSTEYWPLPLMFSVGLSYDGLRTEDWLLTVATDAKIPNNESKYLNVGMELMWSDLISLRAGYNSLFKEAAEEGISAGIGIQYDFGGFTVKVDYSYTDFGIFSEISRYTLSVGL